MAGAAVKRGEWCLFLAFLVALIFDGVMTLHGVGLKGVGAEGNPVVRGILSEAGTFGLVLYSLQHTAALLFATLSRIELIRRAGVAGLGLGAIGHTFAGLTGLWL